MIVLGLTISQVPQIVNTLNATQFSYVMEQSESDFDFELILDFNDDITENQESNLIELLTMSGVDIFTQYQKTPCNL